LSRGVSCSDPGGRCPGPCGSARPFQKVSRQRSASRN
jgi:hypothetical protein